ncbi:MAG: TSUP family transporter [Acidimicrobiia bacterium]
MALFLLLVFPAAVLAGGVAALAGFGIGSLLTPLVALRVGIKAAVILVAVPHLAASALRLWMLRGHIEHGVLLTFGAASAAGGLAGALLHGRLGSRTLGIVLGALLTFAGIGGLSGISVRWRIRGGGWAVLAGGLSGGFGGLVGNQGGIRSAALLHLGLSRTGLVATASGIALAVDLARIPVYAVTGWEELAQGWPLVAVMAGGTLIGTVLGEPVLRRVPDRLFRRVVFLLVTALGLALIAGLGA